MQGFVVGKHDEKKSTLKVVIFVEIWGKSSRKIGVFMRFCAKTTIEKYVFTIGNLHQL